MNLRKENISKSILFMESLEEELEIYKSNDLRKEIEKEIDNGICKIVFDIKNIKYVDSSGIGTLIFVNKKLKAKNGDIVLVGMQPAVKKVFEMTRTDKFFKLAETKEKALELISKV